MELVELSRKDLLEVNKKLYNIIKNDYEYDLVIFIAKGSYIIGVDLANYNNVPLLEIFATRKGGKIKKFVSPFLKIIPKRIKSMLRKKEFNSNYHEKNFERKITFNDQKWKLYKKCKKILLVDDSVDTGYSIKFAKETISNYFDNADVRVAALNCFNKSKKIVKTDFYLYEDKMLMGPWSNDSKENKSYLDEYYLWHNNRN